MRKFALATLMITVLGGLSAVDAAAASSPVVPAGGKVAGKGYGYYLERTTQQIYASKKGQKLPDCTTIAVGGTKVTLLTGQSKTFTCDVPAGRAVYYDVLSSDCGSFKGDHTVGHTTYGTSAADLKKCAKATVKGATVSASLDAKSVGETKLFAVTGVYAVKLSKTDNVFGKKKLDGKSGRDVAAGYGLLLSGLSKGVHTIVAKGAIPAEKYKSSQTVVVTVS